MSLRVYINENLSSIFSLRQDSFLKSTKFEAAFDQSFIPKLSRLCLVAFPLLTLLFTRHHESHHSILGPRLRSLRNSEDIQLT